MYAILTFLITIGLIATTWHISLIGKQQRGSSIIKNYAFAAVIEALTSLILLAILFLKS